MIAAVATAALAVAIESPMRATRLRYSIVGAEVYDLDAKRVLYARNAQTLMVAASTTKLLTEGTSLALLGPDFRWMTPVYRTGTVESSGVLRGDLVLVASGDPNLSQRIRKDGALTFEDEDHAYDGSPETKAVPGDPLAVLRELAAQVRKSGITRLEGNVVIDTSLFPDQGAEGGTGVIVSPIVVNDNVVDVTVTPGQSAGDPVSVSVSPQTPYVTFVNQAKTGTPKSDAAIDLSSDVRDATGHHVVTITGTQAPGPSILYAYRVPEPKLFAQAAFTMALQDAGVAVAPPASPAPSPVGPYDPANLVARHVSPPLSEDAYITLKVSDNLHAGLMPYMWAVYLAHAKSDYLKAGFALEDKMLAGAGLDVNQAIQEDGLGSSAYFTPDFMAHYLAWVRLQQWYPLLLRGLPILGVDGTLASIQTKSVARGKIFAKTGTDGGEDYLGDDEFVQKGLAGYMTTRGGRHVAFAFYVGTIKGTPHEDTGHFAGEVLGAMATATYTSI